MKLETNSALKLMPLDVNSPTTINVSTGTWFWILCSLSTINFTVTDWTLPADKFGLTFLHKTGESSKPTILSKILLACWEFTKLWLISLGELTAFKTAFLVISLKVIRLVSDDFKFKAWSRCHEIASPSRSSSVANHIKSHFFAILFNSLTTFFLSCGTM